MKRRSHDLVELTLSFEAGRWRARGDGIDVEHAELPELDRLIARDAAGGRPGTRVHVRFDVGGLPEWMRQYQAHYFNYVLTLTSRGEPG